VDLSGKRDQPSPSLYKAYTHFTNRVISEKDDDYTTGWELYRVIGRWVQRSSIVIVASLYLSEIFHAEDESSIRTEIHVLVSQNVLHADQLSNVCNQFVSLRLSIPSPLTSHSGIVKFLGCRIQIDHSNVATNRQTVLVDDGTVRRLKRNWVVECDMGAHTFPLPAGPITSCAYFIAYLKLRVIGILPDEKSDRYSNGAEPYVSRVI